jgi:3-phenylpropionate/trans-cinnamate dioxygenase ferredoxin reductase subunit
MTAVGPYPGDTIGKEPRRGATKADMTPDSHDERLPYFFSDQYDVGMEYVGFARAYDRVVFRR